MYNWKDIILCGPSAAGKDTVARAVYSAISKTGRNCNLVISNTTRPMRQGEKQDVDYHFCANFKEFDNYDYLEQTVFRGWRYGTPINNLKENCQNILVLNPSGIYSVVKKLDNFTIFYLTENFFVRLMRSIKREKGFNLQMLRRGIADFINFRKFKRFCEKNYITCYKIKNKDVDSTVRIIGHFFAF